MKTSRLHFRRPRSAGVTLIEISLIIALLMGLLAVIFLGIGSYKKGSDRATCRMQLAAAQKAVRSQANLQNLAIGATFPTSEAFGPGKALENEPSCPSGGIYTWTESIPLVGSSYGSCDFADADGVTSHILATTDMKDW